MIHGVLQKQRGDRLNLVLGTSQKQTNDVLHVNIFYLELHATLVALIILSGSR